MDIPADHVPEAHGLAAAFTDILRRRARQQPGRLLYTFLLDGEADEVSITYGELDRQARAVAALLRSLGGPGERTLLLYPPGLEYIAAFFGCLYAGMIAVPAYPPRSERTLPRLQSIVADSQSTIALSTTPLLSTLERIFANTPQMRRLKWVSTSGLDESQAESWQQTEVTGDTVAFLQYTSGSTARPKGVMLTHRNLIHNSELISRAYRTSSESVGVSWLPPYHDMGLIGQILNPLYNGARMVLMSPGAFLQRPYRWLRAISAYRATHSGGPNFAYELCARKITPEQRETLNLSQWRVAFNGAEPIRRETLSLFAGTFAPCGFRREAFHPCYGLAEATLMVSCKSKSGPPAVKTVRAAALEQNRVAEALTIDDGARVLVGSGQTLLEQRIVIADPETLSRCRPDEVGEVWVSGPSVARGYWNLPEETERTFNAYLSDTGEGPFLRTGDLGFLHHEQLFVTGRIKDLIIVYGRNLYPQDIEMSAERSHPALRHGCGAAFSVPVNGEEQLVVVQELEFRQRPNLAEVSKAIRRAVAEEHGIQLHDVVLLKPGSIPKTSSGKIQRHACKTGFLAGTLEVAADGRPTRNPARVERALIQQPSEMEGRHGGPTANI
jgi:acyl-CoA synthetase (AMP-forming)/AMP-acid ligase II